MSQLSPQSSVSSFDVRHSPHLESLPRDSHAIFLRSFPHPKKDRNSRSPASILLMITILSDSPGRSSKTLLERRGLLSTGILVTAWTSMRYVPCVSFLYSVCLCSGTYLNVFPQIVINNSVSHKKSVQWSSTQPENISLDSYSFNSVSPIYELETAQYLEEADDENEMPFSFFPLVRM